MSQFVEDEQNDFIKVATITNQSDRIVRLVAKGTHSFTIETLYCSLGQYQWNAEHVFVGREEIEQMYHALQTLPKEEP